MRLIIRITFCLFTQEIAPQVEKPRPTFSDYQVKNIYRVPARLLITKEFRSFRTMIRKGADSGVQFAGYYTGDVEPIAMDSSLSIPSAAGSPKDVE